MRKYIVTNVTVRALMEKEKAIEAELREIGTALYAERKRCTHKYVPFDKYDPTDKWFSSSCYCEVCGNDGKTWWCPKSPNGLCEYKQPSGHYNSDHCIYCHHPDERK